MSSPAPSRPRRTRTTAGALLAALAPSFLAVLTVAAVITSLHVWRQQENPARVAGVKAGPQVDSRDASSTAPPTPAASPSQSVTAESARPTATPSTSVASPSSASATTATRLPVAVLNQTRRSGLAARVAAQLRGKGWTVARVGNFRGTIARTTVYYPDGAAAQAAAVAKDLSVAARTQGAFDTLPSNRLTVIVTNDYPRSN